MKEHVDGARVTRVLLEIGELSGIVPDAVRFAFDLCAAGTPLEGANLEIAAIPGRAHCRACGEDVGLQVLVAICPCGSADVEILSGRELRIKEVEVA